MKHYKMVIIGSGPSGYTAALYAARANLDPLVYEGFFSGPAGGQLMTTTDVENYPGFPQGVLGPDLMKNFREQAQRFGTHFLLEDVERVDFSKPPFVIYGKKSSVTASSVIISTGAMAKRLDIPGTREGELWQKGVTACAICDGAMPLFRNKDLFVIGGGDSAVEEAIFLTKFGSKVYLVHRRDTLRASKIMAQRAIEHPKIEILWNQEICEVSGQNHVESVTLKNNRDGSTTTREAAGVFFAVGHTPNTAFLDGQITLHDNGYIRVEPGTTRTNIPGVFAAGDVQDFTYRQAVTAAGTGCMAALEAERWLQETS